MIQIVISTFLVWVFFRFKEKNGQISGLTAISLVLVPALIVFLASIAIVATGLPGWFIYILRLSYFIVPFLFLKSITDYSTAKIAGYSAIVLVISSIGQIAVAVLLGFSNV